MTSSPMIERVAKALAERRCELINAPLANIWPELARAALEAMRAAPEVCYEYYRCDKMWRDLNSTEVWNLWLDAALSTVAVPKEYCIDCDREVSSPCGEAGCRMRLVRVVVLKGEG